MSYKPISLQERLRNASDNVTGQTHIIFGGTGAVGGATAVLMIQFYETLIRSRQLKTFPTIILTGSSFVEIQEFIARLHKLFILQQGHRTLDYITKSGIRLIFREFKAEPVFQASANAVTYSDLKRRILTLTSPFEEFVRKIMIQYELRAVRSVICGVPIASIATYRMNDLEKMGKVLNISEKKMTLLKEELLKTLAKGLGRIKEGMAEQVLIAHTTGVGGMYDDHGNHRNIRLGFAHSALVELLKDKNRFADLLTKEYTKYHLLTFVTAAAIGINNVLTKTKLPWSGQVFSKILRQVNTAKEDGSTPSRDLLDLSASKTIKQYPAKTIPLHHPSGKEMHFSDKSKPLSNELKVAIALRSGENGLFSVDNALALYLVMKVTSPEELAVPLATTAMFGDDPQKPWFDKRGICYYTETDNSSLVFAFLQNHDMIVKESFRPFSLKSYQDLGSSKHQAELHTLGLYGLLSRFLFLRQYPNLLKYAQPDKVEMFLEKHTPIPCIEDFTRWNPNEMESIFSSFLRIRNSKDLARFLHLNYVEQLLYRTVIDKLAIKIAGYFDAITTLGTPIVFRERGVEMMLVGKYVAPFDTFMENEDTITSLVRQQADALGIPSKTLLAWYITNNGFVDLRAEATITTALKADTNLPFKIKTYTSFKNFRQAFGHMESYFTSSGLLAVISRMQGLAEQLGSVDIHLGTNMTWKALFRKEGSKHLLIPGIVEAMRMYQENLGKTTGTECLFPENGYFSRIQ